MGSAFHQLCSRYSGTLTPTAPTAIMLWETFTFFSSPDSVSIHPNCHKFSFLKKVERSSLSNASLEYRLQEWETVAYM